MPPEQVGAKATAIWVYWVSPPIGRVFTEDEDLAAWGGSHQPRALAAAVRRRLMC
jgi:hypothetical protein